MIHIYLITVGIVDLTVFVIFSLVSLDLSRVLLVEITDEEKKDKTTVSFCRST
jgi:hypothetical protein